MIRVSEQEIRLLINIWISTESEYDFEVGKDMIKLYRYKVK